jgi:hypothetical protein
MHNSGVLTLFCDRYGLSEEFQEVYLARYSSSISFIDEIISKRNVGPTCDFYVSYLALNELFSAIRDELRTIILFKNGLPISRWRDGRNFPDIPEECMEVIYAKIQGTFDVLFENGAIVPLSDEPEESGDNFSEIFAWLIFSNKGIETQDAILLTTAILIKAGYFVTKDDKLRREVRDTLKQRYHIELIQPTSALNRLRSMRKRGSFYTKHLSCR